jgi:hypothetical protein
MPADVSHFSMIGFASHMNSPGGLGELVDKHSGRCQPIQLTATDIVCVARDASGGDLWISVRRRADGQNEFITLNPGFAGEGRARIEIVAQNSDPEYLPFEVGVAARFSDQKTPVVFDLADPSQAALAKGGTSLTVDLAAFSFEPKVYSDEQSYLASQAKANVRLAPNFFIPSGSFFEKVGGAMPDDAKRPTAYADFAGKALKVSHRSNVTGGQDFWWALVETYEGATIDVVMDSSTLTKEPKVGSIISGRFWLSGRVVLSPAP